MENEPNHLPEPYRSNERQTDYNNQVSNTRQKPRMDSKKKNKILLLIIVVLFLMGTGKAISLFHFNVFGRAKGGRVGDTKVTVYQKQFTIQNTEDITLNLKGMNGSIQVIGDEDRENIDIKVTYKPKIFTLVHTEQSNMEVNYNNYEIGLKYDPKAFGSVSIEAHIPSHSFQEIIAKTSNGTVEVEDALCGQLNLTSSNGKINLMNSKAEKVNLHTSNSKIILEDIQALELESNTSNGSIEISNVDSEHLVASTSNGSIEYKGDQDYLMKSDQYDIHLTTSNGRINVSLPHNVSVGYQFTGSTSNGSINVKDFTLVTEELSKNRIRARTEEYDQSGRTLDMDIHTSNGSITIQ